MINIDWNAGGITRGYVPPLKGIFGDGLTSNIFTPNAYQQMLEDTAPKIRKSIEPIEDFAERFTKQILGTSPTPKTIQVNQEQIAKLFDKGKNISEVVSENVVEKPNKLNLGKIPFVGGIAKNVAPWLMPIQSGFQTAGNEQQLREMEKWNEYMASQGKPPMYSQEALDIQRKRSTASASPLVGSLIGLLGGPGGALLGGSIGEVANLFQNIRNKDLYNTLQLPQFKGKPGEVLTKVDDVVKFLNSQKGAEAEEVKAKEEIKLPDGLGKVDYTEDWVNNLVALNGLGNPPELRDYATIEEGVNSPIVNQSTPQEVYDNIYKDLLASREKALENQRANIDKLIEAYRSDVSNLRKANLTDTLINSLVGIANPQWQVTMPMLSGNVTYGSTPNKDKTPATDYIKSAPLKSEVTSTINKLKETADQAEIDFELAQAELLDKVNIANQIGIPVSMVNKDTVKALMDNTTKEKIAKWENDRRIYVQGMISGDKAKQREFQKAMKEAELDVKLQLGKMGIDQRMTTGLMNYLGNASMYGDFSGLQYIAPLLGNDELETIIMEYFNNQDGSKFGYGE